jgi:hypothetical protein
MNTRALLTLISLILALGLASSGAIAAALTQIAGSTCEAKPRYACPDAKDCPADVRSVQGDATETKSGRKFLLDFPCDLKKGEKITFILNLHGAGSIGNWQRSYFPAVDLKEKYRLVIATPTALTTEPMRHWMADADDDYLHGIVDQVVDSIGRKNIKAFWLVGHSQGGYTSRRIVCSDFFKDKVDGVVSLSGGRVGTQSTTPPSAMLPPLPPLSCDFSHIYDIGEREAASATATDKSDWAEKYHCGARVRKADVIDERPGYVTASDQTRGPSWGTTARPGTAQVYEFPKCKDDRIVVDVIRMQKGHTEGLEPKIMDTIVRYIERAKGGKLARGT